MFQRSSFPFPFPLLQKREAERASSLSSRVPGAAAGSLPLLRPLRRRKGGGTPDMCARGVYRGWRSVVGGGACVGAAAARTAWCFSPSGLLLAGVPFIGGGCVGVLPRGRLVDADGLVRWRSCPWALPSFHRRFLRRRWGLAKVCWRRPRSSSPWLLGEGGDFPFAVVLGSSSPSPCRYGVTEIGDFPSATTLLVEQGFSSALRGSGGGSAAARPRSASVVEDEPLEDLFVISLLFKVLCTSVKG